MNKYELKYMLETMTSSVDRLTDSLGKQSLHIENLWHEIGQKQNLISIADSSSYKANKAYIYYHIWLYMLDDEYKNLAYSIFTNLYKKKPKYRFVYFTNKLK